MVQEIKKGSPILQYIAALSANLAIVCDGMYNGWASPSVPQLTDPATCTICIDEDEGSTLAIMPIVGAAAGSLTAAYIVDHIGRKRTILATAIPFFAGWMAVAFSKSSIPLYIARFVAGAAGGATFTVVPMYIGEISDAKIRGLLGSSCSVMWAAGFLMINAIGSYLSIQTTALISSAVPALLLVTFFWMPESPYQFLMKDQPEEARKSLERLRGTGNVDEDLNRMSTAIQEERKTHKGKFVDLFRVPSNRRAVLVVGGLRGAQQLSGITAIALYTHEIFNAAGGQMPANYAVMIYYAVQLTLTAVSSSIVDKAGRRPLLLISMGGATAALFVEGLYFFLLDATSIDTTSFSALAVVGLLAFVIMFGFGMQTVPILMLGELFPTNVKAFALCLADMYFSAVATAASKYLQITKDEFGLHVSFWGFAICSALGFVFIYFFVPETKGKTLEDIQRGSEKTEKEAEDENYV